MPGRYRSEASSTSDSSLDHHQFGPVDNGAAPTAQSLRQLRRDVASAVSVVTTSDEGGFGGVTVSAFCIVSVEPPRLLICLGTEGDAAAAVQRQGHFALNVLSDRHEFLADQFAGRAPAVNSRFTGVKHKISALGDPVLEECLVWFSCAVDGTTIQGDHIVIYGDIREAGVGTGREPLLYFDGSYRYFQAD